MKKFKSNNSYTFYNVISRIIVFLGNIFFGGKCLHKENIPLEGKCILAGNHTSNFDSYLLFKSCKRLIHILGKKELFESPFGWVFKKMHLIKIDRQNSNPEAKEEVLNILQDDKVIGMFPEGTFHKDDILLPFKPGVISFAEKSSSPIIPFAIIGKFSFRSHPKIVWGEGINITKIKGDKVKYLEDVIKELIMKNS